MGTVVTLQVLGPSDIKAHGQERSDAITRAVHWFHHVERTCSRFEPASELRKLSANIGVPCTVSELLLEAVQFALAVAEESDGAFDPTIGQRMEQRGFNRNYQTGHVSTSMLTYTARVSYRDVEVDSQARSITLHKPLLLDLGAVAKGLAIDLAARELLPMQNYEINAGGDVYVAGVSPRGDDWRVGIRHPREAGALIGSVNVSNVAVCTSGDYERVNDTTGEHHIINADTNITASELASVTVIAGSAMVADALATAAFALGPKAGVRLINRHQLDALFITPALAKISTGTLSLV